MKNLSVLSLFIILTFTHCSSSGSNPEIDLILSCSGTDADGDGFYILDPTIDDTTDDATDDTTGSNSLLIAPVNRGERS